MSKHIRTLLVLTMFQWCSGISALPFTYDFGFDRPQNGFTGTGYISVAELSGAIGLVDFSYRGECAGVMCEFGLADITDMPLWTLDPDGAITSLSIAAEEMATSGLHGPVIPGVAAFTDALSSQCVVVSDGLGCAEGISSIARFAFYHYLGPRLPGPFITVRSTDMPASPTLALFLGSLAGLYLFRRKHSTH